MASKSTKGNVLTRTYRSRIGEPTTGSEATGYWLFLAGIVLGALGIALALSSGPLTELRRWGITLGAVGLVFLLVGPVVRLPLRRTAKLVAGLGAVVSLAAVVWFAVGYPANWSPTSGNVTIIALYVLGTAIIGLGGVLIPLATPPEDPELLALREQTDRDATAIADLRSGIDDRESRIADLSETIETNESMVESLREDLERKQERVADLEAETETDDRLIAQLRSEIAELSTVVDDLEAKLADDERRLAELDDELDAERSRVADLEAQAETDRETVLGLIEEMEEKEATVAEIDRELTAERATVESLEEELERKTAHVVALEERVETDEAANRSLQSEVDDRVAEIDDLNDDLSNAKVVVADLEREVETVEAERMALVDELDALHTSQARFEIFEDAAGEYRWRLRHRNGNVIATAGQGYTVRRNAQKGLESVRRNALGGDVIRIDPDAVEADAETDDAVEAGSESTDEDAAVDADDEATADSEFVPFPVADSESHFDVFEDDGGKWRWNLRDGDGTVVAHGGQGYASKRNVDRAIESVRNTVGPATYLRIDPTAFEVYRDNAGEYRWRMVHRNGNVLADGGRGYETRSAARDVVEAIRAGATDADVEEIEN